MAPRSYSMERRRASVEATRKRIVEATLSLHAERGIFGTSWRDIAERADVSVATVYKHFPTLEELVPACGRMVERISAPPTIGDIPSTFADAHVLDDRVARLVAVFLDFYERGEPYLEVDARERRMPMVQEWEAHMRAVREGFVREALRPVDPDETVVRAVAALLDFPVYGSFRRQDLPRTAIAETLRELLTRWLAGLMDRAAGR